MNVEFLNTESYGPCIRVSQSECAKAKKNNQELESLMMAVDSFMAWAGINESFGEDLYDRLINALPRSSYIIFCAEQPDYYRINRLSILISDRGIARNVFFWDAGGYVINLADE